MTSHHSRFHETAKQKSLRIPLDYVDSMDGIQYWKYALSIAAVTIAAGYGLWLFWPSSGASLQFSPGLLISGHAAWEKDCTACHRSFVPLRDDSLQLTALAATGGSNEDRVNMRRLLDSKCQVCHPAVGIHNPLELSHEVAACTSCHRDHQGRMAKLTDLADQQCVACHQQIQIHTAPRSTTNLTPLANVSKFTSAMATESGHPEFRSLALDASGIKFSHAVHMVPGIPPFAAAVAPSQTTVVAGPERSSLLTLDRLPAEFLEKYRRSDQPQARNLDSNYLVQLECATCHAANPAVGFKNETPLAKFDIQDGTNARMRMPAYEHDCRPCHSLPYRFPASADMLQLPHGLLPLEIRQHLLGEVVSRDTHSRDVEFPRADLLSPVPGREDENSKQRNRAFGFEEAVRFAERLLRDSQTCCKCHVDAAITAEQPETNLLPGIEPVKLRSRWLGSADFNHGAHRFMTCKDCHPAASQSISDERQQRASASLSLSCSPDDPNAPRDQNHVDIMGRMGCAECHAATVPKHNKVSASGSCVTCHKYHLVAPAQEQP